MSRRARKYFKWSAAFLLLLAVGLFFSQSAGAHPPTSIQLSYNPANSTLAVTVMHTVDNPKSHYIESISVFTKGKVLAQKNYTSQTSNTEQRDTFVLSGVASGTEIRVEAVCNIMGSSEAILKIP